MPRAAFLYTEFSKKKKHSECRLVYAHKKVLRGFNNKFSSYDFLKTRHKFRRPYYLVSDVQGIWNHTICMLSYRMSHTTGM
jgi:hypothetical protein